MWVRIFDFKPKAQIALQSCRDCGEADGDVSSMYSTPNSDNAVAIAIFVGRSKKALANCSPSRSVDSMILKFLMLESRSVYRGSEVGACAIGTAGAGMGSPVVLVGDCVFWTGECTASAILTFFAGGDIFCFFSSLSFNFPTHKYSATLFILKLLRIHISEPSATVHQLKIQQPQSSSPHPFHRQLLRIQHVCYLTKV